MAAHVQRFIDLYQRLSADNLDGLGEIYHPDIHFCDPLHQIHGLDALRCYFAAMYGGVVHIEFAIQRQVVADTQACIEWVMRYRHQKLERGEIIEVNGMSWLVFGEDQKIISHRDYFDAGQMLYEHITLLGGAIRYLKGRLQV